MVTVASLAKAGNNSEDAVDSLRKCVSLLAGNLRSLHTSAVHVKYVCCLPLAFCFLPNGRRPKPAELHG